MAPNTRNSSRTTRSATAKAAKQTELQSSSRKKGFIGRRKKEEKNDENEEEMEVATVEEELKMAIDEENEDEEMLAKKIVDRTRKQMAEVVLTRKRSTQSDKQISAQESEPEQDQNFNPASAGAATTSTADATSETRLPTLPVLQDITSRFAPPTPTSAPNQLITPFATSHKSVPHPARPSRSVKVPASPALEMPPSPLPPSSPPVESSQDALGPSYSTGTALIAGLGEREDDDEDDGEVGEEAILRSFRPSRLDFRKATSERSVQPEPVDPADPFGFFSAEKRLKAARMKQNPEVQSDIVPPLEPQFQPTSPPAHPSRSSTPDIYAREDEMLLIPSLQTQPQRKTAHNTDEYMVVEEDGSLLPLPRTPRKANRTRGVHSTASETADSPRTGSLPSSPSPAKIPSKGVRRKVGGKGKAKAENEDDEETEREGDGDGDSETETSTPKLPAKRTRTVRSSASARPTTITKVAAQTRGRKKRKLDADASIDAGADPAEIARLLVARLPKRRSREEKEQAKAKRGSDTLEKAAGKKGNGVKTGTGKGKWKPVVSDSSNDEEEEEEISSPRKRGRPPSSRGTTTVRGGRGRGRSRPPTIQRNDNSANTKDAPRGGRGRPRKVFKEAEESDGEDFDLKDSDGDDARHIKERVEYFKKLEKYKVAKENVYVV